MGGLDQSLRLWLALFVDMPDDFKKSLEPLLPNLAFKLPVIHWSAYRRQNFSSGGHPPAGSSGRLQSLKEKAGLFHTVYWLPLYRAGRTECFRAILDAEIAARRADSRFNCFRQNRVLFSNKSGPQQTELDLSKEMKELRAGLEVKYLSSRPEKSSLAEEPLYLGIEFAEIF